MYKSGFEVKCAVLKYSNNSSRHLQTTVKSALSSCA